MMQHILAAKEICTSCLAAEGIWCKTLISCSACWFRMAKAKQDKEAKELEMYEHVSLTVTVFQVSFGMMQAVLTL